MQRLADRIRSARLDAGIKEPADLARRVGVKPAAAYQWESGDTKSLKAETAVALAEELGVSIKWLATGKGPRHEAGESNVSKLDVDLLHSAILITERALHAKHVTVKPEGRAEITLAAYDLLREGQQLQSAERVVARMLQAIGGSASTTT